MKGVFVGMVVTSAINQMHPSCIDCIKLATKILESLNGRPIQPLQRSPPTDGDAAVSGIVDHADAFFRCCSLLSGAKWLRPCGVCASMPVRSGSFSVDASFSCRALPS